MILYQVRFPVHTETCSTFVTEMFSNKKIADEYADKVNGTVTKIRVKLLD